jgi:DNA-binding MarR family transcriptional regulator
MNSSRTTTQRREAPAIVDIRRVERKRRAAQRVRGTHAPQTYFDGIAKAHFVMRKASRIVEDQAKAMGLDPLAHQALIQIRGGPNRQLQVNQLAEKLDIAPAFASSLAATLVKSGLATRKRCKEDQRVTFIAITTDGKHLLAEIDKRVSLHVSDFTRHLTQDQREHALSTLLFYVGASMA